MFTYSGDYTLSVAADDKRKPKMFIICVDKVVYGRKNILL